MYRTDHRVKALSQRFAFLCPQTFERHTIVSRGHALRRTGGALQWQVRPGAEVRGRTVLVVDDVLDMGTTLAAVVEDLERLGAREVVTSVLVVKDVAQPDRLRVDETALYCPDRYLFGHGMDYRGHWRNLAGIYALPTDWVD